MAYFFQKNRQRIAQWNPTRRAAPWGRGPIPQIVLHTFEWPANRSMLSAATYLLNRTTHGSYHSLAGGTSRRDVLRLAPVTAETWHCVPSNNWASGVSATTYAANWNKLTATQRRNFVHSMAYASYLLSQELIAIGKAPVPAKRISRAQAMRGVWGFTYHRTMDPGRRTDPAHPEHNFPWDMFLTEYNRLMGSSSAPTPGKDWLEMATADEVARAVWGYKNERLTSQDAYAILRNLTPIRDRVTKTNHAMGRVENNLLPAILDNLGIEVDAGEVAAALVEHLDIEGAVSRALEALPERDTAEVAQRVREDIAARLTEGE